MKVMTLWYLTGQNRPFQIFGFRLHNSAGYLTTGIDSNISDVLKAMHSTFKITRKTSVLTITQYGIFSTHGNTHSNLCMQVNCGVIKNILHWIKFLWNLQSTHLKSLFLPPMLQFLGTWALSIIWVLTRDNVVKHWIKIGLDHRTPSLQGCSEVVSKTV